ncbi:MAG: DUF1249 domain-containing protein [Gammaproteobacteria bacterium]|jgi:uncharacterized protein YqiB (DUF1249 family)
MNVKPYTIELSEQMAVCDANYIRLLKLMGRSDSFDKNKKRMVALPVLGQGLREEQVYVSLEVQEEFKYTSTISVKQLLGSRENSQEKIEGIPAYYNAPEIIIRVYHDAKTAEVVSYQNHNNFKAIYPVPNRFMYQSDEKEQLNLFLAEWLNLCINEGLSNPEELQLDKLTLI